MKVSTHQSISNNNPIKVISSIFGKLTDREVILCKDIDIDEFIYTFSSGFNVKPSTERYNEVDIAELSLKFLSFDTSIDVNSLGKNNLPIEDNTMSQFGYKAEFSTFAGGAGVATMAILILRTYIHFIKDENGKVKFEIKIKPISDKDISQLILVAKELVSKLITNKNNVE